MKRLRQVAIATLSAAALVLAGAMAGDYLRLRQYRRALGSPDATVRKRALDGIAEQRERRLSAEVNHLLKSESEPALLEMGGCAAMRIGDMHALKIIRERVDTGPDSRARAKLMTYAARLSGRDLRLSDWLRAGLASEEPWRRVGAAVALLELGRPEGGQALLEMYRGLEPEALAFGVKEFRRIAEPMTEAVGKPLAVWPDTAADESAWALLREFWDEHAGVTLLNDVLNRLERLDPKWHEVNRLLHARPRAERWLQ